MAVPSHNSRVGSAGARDPPSTGRNPSDYHPYPAPYYPTTSSAPDGSALVGSALYSQPSSTSPTPVTSARRNNLLAAQSAARGARNYGGARQDYQGSERGPATTAQQQQQQWLGASVMPRVSTGTRTARGRNFEGDALVPPAYNNAPVAAAAAAVTAAYPVASAAPRSTASSSSLSPTSLSSLLYNQGVSNGTTGGGSIALPWGAAPHRTPRGGPQGPSGVRPPHHNHAPGQVNSMLRVEVPPLAEQYPPTQYSTTEMVLAEFGPGYADLSKRELLRIIRRHAPDAFLEEYNLKGQIYNAIKSRSHSQFVQLAEQLMENYIVYCGFQNGASLPTDPQVAATAASIAAKMGVTGGQTTTAGGQAPAAAAATTTGAQGAPLRGDGLTTQISASLGNGVSDDDEVTTPPPGFESVLPTLFGPQQQQQPFSSVASASDDVAPSLSSFDNMASVSVQAERGSSAASTLSVDAPSFTPNTELQRGRYSWDTQSLSHQQQASRLDTAPADDSLAKLAEQLVRTYGLGRTDMVGLPGLAASPRNAPTTGTNVSVAGSGPRTNASSSSSDSVGLCSMGGLSGQFDLSTSGTSGSSHLSATAPAFTPSNASWWNPMSSAPTSSSVSESSAAIPPSATNAANLAGSSNLAGWGSAEAGDTVDTATLASLIANLSSTSPSSASSTPHVSVASDHNINTEVLANGLAQQQQQQQGESKSDQEESVEGQQRPSNDDDSLPGSSSK